MFDEVLKRLFIIYNVIKMQNLELYDSIYKYYYRVPDFNAPRALKMRLIIAKSVMINDLLQRNCLEKCLGNI